MQPGATPEANAATPAADTSPDSELPSQPRRCRPVIIDARDFRPGRFRPESVSPEDFRPAATLAEVLEFRAPRPSRRRLAGLPLAAVESTPSTHATGSEVPAMPQRSAYARGEGGS
jgi:hypothetical protein